MDDVLQLLQHMIQRFLDIAAIGISIAEAPLRALYMTGPSFPGGFGFWRSRDPQDICSELTNTPSAHWDIHFDQCDDLIDKRFRSFMITLYAFVYSGTLLLCYITLLRQVGAALASRCTRTRQPPPPLTLATTTSTRKEGQQEGVVEGFPGYAGESLATDSFTISLTRVRSPTSFHVSQTCPSQVQSLPPTKSQDPQSSS